MIHCSLLIFRMFYFCQGEDRWLCTLLLQEGYRVEYCAASDALTYAPESFHVRFEFRVFLEKINDEILGIF